MTKAILGLILRPDLRPIISSDRLLWEIKEESFDVTKAKRLLDSVLRYTREEVLTDKIVWHREYVGQGGADMPGEVLQASSQISC
jgi:hypothetical protein